MNSYPLRLEFVSSFRGEATYKVGGDKFSVRYWGHDDGHYNGDYFETGIKPSIGCVRYESPSKWHEFPPTEVVEFFPGFVGQRLIYHRADNLPITHPDHKIGTMEYVCNGPTPELIFDVESCCGYLWSVAVLELQQVRRREFDALATIGGAT